MNMNNEIRFLSPIDGDMLNERDGKVIDGCLVTEVKVLAPSGCRIVINGIPALCEYGVYTTNVQLKDYSNIIHIVDEVSGYTTSMTVYWLRNYTNSYRLSMDDNIWFLRDIAYNADKYRSIFENPYLGFFKKVHDEYGSKVHFNIYYQDEEFNLTHMPVKYKSEWRDNSDWIRLSFHALQDKPDMPYINAGYDQVRRDCEMVMEQVRRFAGEEVTGQVTTLHWGEATIDGCRALRNVGYKCQVCDFNVDNDLPPCSYYLDDEKRRHMSKRFIWKDNSEDIIFTRLAIVTDCHKLENIVPYLDKIWKEPKKSGYIDFCMHEQYFYPQYIAYQSNYREKVLTTVRWAVEKSYKPAFLSECVFK